ncbi:MAG: two-component system response regulator [Candidatus Wallbacteria bacterium HGW-Wallbacteria-1]|jgi:two-component system alkaline phosphatase synthesis response regulator PhoP|uniref:Two-component system response regulator n=1 Tax=Candidatus Wallbacteria bacterium HGW-Wallbacteria-1 TaxID=2013854 RepID=A0A2N1PSS6_9BACT|nr:MAG: two-component system response regulator [Candidatus Wallbacteria bacterium HGW-Wallbacteria-1]
MEPAKILVVDDERHLVRIIIFNLKKSGYITDFAHDGEEALAKVAEFKPDLVILDVMMPKLTGYQVCEKMKADESMSSIPIILLTAKGQDPDRDMAHKFGADEYMTKPFSPRLLMDTVARLLS